MRAFMFVSSAVLGLATCAYGQSDRVYLQATGTLTIQRADEPIGRGPDIPKPGVSGHALGVSAGAAWLPRPMFSIGGEVSHAARFTAVQETIYSLIFLNENRHRDTIVSALAGVNVHAGSRTTLSAVVGPSAVRENTLRRRADQIGPRFFYTGQYGPYVDDVPFKAWRPGLTFGGDVAVAVADRFDLVGGLRVHVVKRDSDEDDHNIILQMSDVVYRPQVGARVRF